MSEKITRPSKGLFKGRYVYDYNGIRSVADTIRLGYSGCDRYGGVCYIEGFYKSGELAFLAIGDDIYRQAKKLLNNGE
jgi:hypothetical protein